MKRFRNLVALPMVLALMFGLVACDQKPSNQNKVQAEVNIKDKVHDSKYICPMYCPGSGSQEPGDCPDCHMHYVENKDYNAPK